MSVPPHQDRATGGLYRSAHAARDVDRPAPGDATLISVDDPVPGYVLDLLRDAALLGVAGWLVVRPSSPLSADRRLGLVPAPTR